MSGIVLTLANINLFLWSYIIHINMTLFLCILFVKFSEYTLCENIHIPNQCLLLEHFIIFFNVRFYALAIL